MIKRVLVISGVVLFLIGVGLGLYLVSASLRASGLTSVTSGPTCPPPAICSPLPFPIDLTVNTSSNVILEGSTVVVAANVFNATGKPVSLRLTAPGFDPTATQPEHMVPAADEATLNWVLTPIRIGTFQVVVEMDDMSGNVLLTKYVGITVTNVLGLKPWLLQLLAYASTILGPVLTVPWWYERWKERKEKKKDEKHPASSAQPSVSTLKTRKRKRGRSGR